MCVCVGGGGGGWTINYYLALLLVCAVYMTLDGNSIVIYFADYMASSKIDTLKGVAPYTATY